MNKEKKAQVRIIRVYQKVNTEIDYDKLAEAITKANDRQNQKNSISREWMKFIIYPVLWGIAIMLGIFALAFIGYGIGTMMSALNGFMNTNVQQLAAGFFSFGLGFFMFSICVATGFTAKEIDKETDRQYVASMFSNVVALVALVVSLLAFLKG